MIAGFLAGAAHGALAAATEIMLEIEPTTASGDVLTTQISSAPTPTGGLVVAWSNSQTDGDVQVFHVNRAGTVLWARTIGNKATTDYQCHSVRYVGNGNYLLGIWCTTEGGVPTVISQASGSIVWADISATLAAVDAGYDSSGNIYLGDDGYLVKYNSAGTIQWQYRMNYTGSELSYGLSTLSNGTTIVSAAAQVSSYYRAVLFAADQNGSFLWDKYYSVGDADHYPTRISIDNNEDVVFATDYQTTFREIHVVKASNSTGAISWARKITMAINNLYIRGICTDSSNNVYLMILNTTAAPDAGYLVKYNSSGAIQAQLKITTTGNEFLSGRNDATGVGAIYWNNGFLVVSLVGATNHGIIIRIQDDLSTTGAVAGEDDTITLASTSDMVDAVSAIAANDITGTYASNAFSISDYTDATSVAYTDYTTTVTAIP